MNLHADSVPAALLLVAAGSIWLGCGSAPPTHYYSLAMPAEIERSPISTASDARGPIRVGVTAFRIDAPYDGGRLVYRIGDSPQEISFYSYHRWAHPLSDDLSLAVAEILSKQLDAVSIEPADVGRDYDVLLGGRLLYLEEVTLAQAVQTRVGLVLDLSTTGGELLWSQQVSAVSSGDPGEVSDLVRQMRSTLENALQEGRDGLSAALEVHQ